MPLVQSLRRCSPIGPLGNTANMSLCSLMLKHYRRDISNAESLSAALRMVLGCCHSDHWPGVATNVAHTHAEPGFLHRATIDDSTAHTACLLAMQRFGQLSFHLMIHMPPIPLPSFAESVSALHQPTTYTSAASILSTLLINAYIRQGVASPIRAGTISTCQQSAAAVVSIYAVQVTFGMLCHVAQVPRAVGSEPTYSRDKISIEGMAAYLAIASLLYLLVLNACGRRNTSFLLWSQFMSQSATYLYSPARMGTSRVLLAYMGSYHVAA